MPRKPSLTADRQVSNKYYDAGGISTIDVIRAKLTPEQFKGFLLGNAIKYALRMNHKGVPVTDAAKMSEYAVWLAEYELENNSVGSKISAPD